MSRAAYKPEFADTARKICARFGAINVDLADIFDVTPRTITNWMTEHEEFAAAVSVGKDAADKRVEHSLFQRAVGYSYEATHFSTYKGEVTETPYTEHMPPDTTACIFWLKNRRPEEWRDVHLMHGHLQVTPGYELSNLTEDELVAFRQLAEKARPRAPIMHAEAPPVAEAAAVEPPK